MYISLGLFSAVSVLLFVLCVMLAYCKSQQSTAQQTNQFVSQRPPGDSHVLLCDWQLIHRQHL